MDRRVVITGLGIVGSKFNNRNDFWEVLYKNKLSIDELDNTNSDLIKVKVAGKIGNNQLGKPSCNRRLLMKCDNFSIYSLLAVDEALKDANINVADLLSDRIGIYVGNNSGGWNAARNGLVDLHSNGLRNVNPFLASNWFPAAAQGHLSINHKFTGYSKTIAADMSSSNISIGNAYNIVKNNKADYMIAGGSENILDDWGMLFYQSSGLLSESKNRKQAYLPFTEQSSGLVLSEGAAFVIMETLESALSRNANIYAEITGHSVTNDGVNSAQGNPNGLQYGRAIKNVLKKGDPQPDFISLNGAAVKNEDLSEVNGINTVFTTHKIVCTCPKVNFGHTFGAAGAMDVIATCLMLKNDTIIKMGNITKVDKCGNIDFVLSEHRREILNSALVINKGLGGINSALRLKKIN